MANLPKKFTTQGIMNQSYDDSTGLPGMVMYGWDGSAAVALKVDSSGNVVLDTTNITLQTVTDAGFVTTNDIQLGNSTASVTTDSPYLYFHGREKPIGSATDILFRAYLDARFPAESCLVIQSGTTKGGMTDAISISESGWLNVGDGTATNPSLGFLSDSNTGFYWSAADYMFLSIGGANMMEYWNSSGFQDYTACYSVLGSYEGLFLYEVASNPFDAGDWTGYAGLWTQADNKLYFKDGADVEHQIAFGAFITKSYTFTSQGVGAGTYYLGGYYDAPAADANLDEGSATVTHGGANASYAAHAFIVAGGAGSASGGSGAVEIEVSGTSITDAGARTTSDTEVIVADITTMSANDYIETSKKWLGTVTFTLQNAGGSTQTTFSADFNYGFCKYEDFENTDFTVTGFEVVGEAGATDSSFNITLIEHNTTGWTYSAAAFVPGGSGTIFDMNTTHSTEQNLINGDPFAMKRTGLSTAVTGSGSEGVIIKVVTGANNSVQALDAHISITV